MGQLQDVLNSQSKLPILGGRGRGLVKGVRWFGAALVLVSASCGERVATIDPSQAQPGSDLSGLKVPEGALVALPDSRVFLVRSSSRCLT